jgi:hypothetical protein
MASLWWSGLVGKELDMATPIDAIRSGMGYDEAGRWHEPRVLYMPPPRRADDLLAPARGAILGLLASSVLWLLVLLAVHILHSIL